MVRFAFLGFLFALVMPAAAFAAGSQTFNSSGTFTVPAYGTLTVTVWGGGGGGGAIYGGAAGNGGVGGQSKFNNAVIANGGNGGLSSENGSASGAGGTASGGDTNTTGNPGSASGISGGTCPISNGKRGGSAPGSGGTGGAGRLYLTYAGSGGAGTAPGAGGGGANGDCDMGGLPYGAGGGGSGAYSTKTYSAGQLTPGASVSVIIGSGGTGGNAPYAGGPGAPGRVTITWTDATPTCSVWADQNPSAYGGSTTLRWTSGGATGFFISNVGYVIPNVSSSATVGPLATTAYNGTATTSTQSTPCNFTLTVTPPPAPTCSLTATPSAITSGQSSTLTWTSTDASTASIDQGIGSVSTQSSSDGGSQTFNASGNFTVPSYDTLTATVWGGGGGGGSTIGTGGGGGPSSFNGTVIGNGASGGGVYPGGAGGAGGTASGGTTNTTGNSGGSRSGVNGGAGGSSPSGGSGGSGGLGTPPSTTSGGPGTTPGGGGGGGGGYSTRTYTAGALTSGASIPIVVGYGGTGATGNIDKADDTRKFTLGRAVWAFFSWFAETAYAYVSNGGAGAPGRVIITWTGNGVTVSPTQTTTYTETVTGPGGSAQCQATVSTPPTCAVSVNPTSIPSGQSSILSWSSTGATTCIGDNFSMGGTESGTPTTVYVTSGSSWTVPSDWNSANNTIEVIGGGGGGGGGCSTCFGSGGGGGGAYSRITNLSLTSGNNISVNVGGAGSGTTNGNGIAGGDTYFNGASCAAASTCAKGGLGGQGANSGGAMKEDPYKSLSVERVLRTVFSYFAEIVHAAGAGGSGGSSATGVGSTKRSGGNGAANNSNAGGGGGGAAGTVGNGNNGSGTSGGSGNAGSGGAGGGAGAAGGNGSEFDATHGSGGGGGAGAASSANGAAGGNYGAGGGGSGGNLTTGGNGKVGLIVIRYYPIIPPTNGSVSVSPSVSTTYTGSCTNPAGTAQCTGTGSGGIGALLTVSCPIAHSCTGAGNQTITRTNDNCSTTNLATCVLPEVCVTGSSICVYSAPSGTFTASPKLVPSGGTTNITWSTSNAVSCSVTGNGNTWSGLSSAASSCSPKSGSACVSNPITEYTTYTLACDDADPDTVENDYTATLRIYLIPSWLEL